MGASGWKILATGTLSCLFQLRSKKIFCTTVTTLLICKFVNEVRICRVCERPRFLRTVCITPEIQRASGFGTLKKGQVNLKWLREDGPRPPSTPRLPAMLGALHSEPSQFSPILPDKDRAPSQVATEDLQSRLRGKPNFGPRGVEVRLIPCM